MKSKLWVDEKELVQRASSGDQRALGELVARYETRVYRLALRMTRDPHDAEDVLQETFISVVRNLNSFTGASSLATWLFRIATNHALMHLRKTKRIDGSIDDSVDLAELPALPYVGSDWSASPVASLLRKETSQKMEDAIKELAEPLRIVFILRDIEGIGGPEVAEILGLTLAAVKSRLHRARLSLRETLAHYFEARTGGDDVIRNSPGLER